MSALNLWVGRYQQAWHEIRSLRAQVDRLTEALDLALRVLDEDQLSRVEEELARLGAATTRPPSGGATDQDR